MTPLDGRRHAIATIALPGGVLYRIKPLGCLQTRLYNQGAALDVAKPCFLDDSSIMDVSIPDELTEGICDISTATVGK